MRPGMAFRLCRARWATQGKGNETEILAAVTLPLRGTGCSGCLLVCAGVCGRATGTRRRGGGQTKACGQDSQRPWSLGSFQVGRGPDTKEVLTDGTRVSRAPGLRIRGNRNRSPRSPR